MPQLWARIDDGLMMVANTVALSPTLTARLVGRSAATGTGTQPPGWVSQSKTPFKVLACTQVPEGLMASPVMPRLPIPLLIFSQLPPPSVLRNTLAPLVPA